VTRFLLRVIGAAALDPSTYEDVEHDRAATPGAVVVVLLASSAAGIGASGLRANVADAFTAVLVTAAAALVAWGCWAFLTYEIGTRLMAEEQTQADVGELLRSLGFSAAPAMALVFGALPGLTGPVFALTSLWMIAAMVLAVRQALDYRSPLRALAVCAVAWLLVLVFVMAIGVIGSPTLGAAPAPDGATLFRTHCATCHGTSGRGDGPTAAALRRPPTDLTRFALDNGGVFPGERLRRVIDGRGVVSHGTPDMPVWGVALKRTEAGVDEAEVAARIDALVRYIMSIQSRHAH
jgi:mono/diheme cytochrome c family protein